MAADGLIVSSSWMPRRVGMVPRLIAAALLACGASSATAEVLLLRAEPDVTLLTEGMVNRSVKRPDGGLILTGDFQYFDGVRVDGVVRLDAQGTVDADWHLPAVRQIDALAVSSADEVFIVGQDPDYPHLMKAGSDGQLVPGWAPEADGRVVSILLDAQDRVWVAGDFKSIGGQPANGLAILDPDTGMLDPTGVDWSEGRVRAMNAGPDGRIYLTYVPPDSDDVTLARVSVGGQMDPAWRPRFDVRPTAVAIGPDGSVYVAGSFSKVNGTPWHSLARILPGGSGELDTAWNPAAGWSGTSTSIQRVSALDVDNTGAVYAAGRFSHTAGVPAVSLAKLHGNGTGAAMAGWVGSAAFEWPVSAVASFMGVTVQAGEVQVIGRFHSTEMGSGMISAMRLDQDSGQLARAQQATRPGTVTTMLHQANGGTLLLGEFLQVDGLSRRNIVRLDATHQVDATWNIDVRGTVHAMDEDGAGGVLLGGEFTIGDSAVLRNLIRVNGEGSADVDLGWLPDPEAAVYAIDVASDGRIYVGGRFWQIGGANQPFLARVDAVTGLLDAAWTPVVEQAVIAMKLDGGAHLYAHHAVPGVSAGAVWRYPTAGSGVRDPGWRSTGVGSSSVLQFDTGGDLVVAGQLPLGTLGIGTVRHFSTSATGTVSPTWEVFRGWSTTGLAIAPSGLIYAGVFPAEADGGLLRILPDGSVDEGFMSGESGPFAAVSIDAGGVLYVGGAFTEVNGERRLGLAAFDLRDDALFIDGFER